MKKILFCLLAVVITACAMVGCSSDSSTTGTTAGETVAQDGISEEEYVNKVKELYQEALDATAELGAGEDGSLESLDAISGLMEAVTPFFEEISNLQAPEKYAQAQEKIKTGANAFLEYSDLMTQFFESLGSGDVDSLAALEEMATDMEEKAQTLESDLQQFTEGLEEVLGEETIQQMQG